MSDQDNGHEPVSQEAIDNVVKFRAPEKAPPSDSTHEHVRAILDTFNDQASQANVEAIAVVAVLHDGRVVSGLTGNENIFEMIGAVQALSHRLLRNLEQNMEGA